MAFSFSLHNSRYKKDPNKSHVADFTNIPIPNKGDIIYYEGEEYLVTRIEREYEYDYFSLGDKEKVKVYTNRKGDKI